MNLTDNALEREPNKAYAEFRKSMMEKYWENILSFHRYYGGMETFIAFAVLCENARAFARGDVAEIWPGGGKVDMNELVQDVKLLDRLAVYKW